MKPDPAIYQSACSMMGVIPGKSFEAGAARVVMVGDSRKWDEIGPRSYGIPGHHLNRKGAGRFGDLFAFSQAMMNF